MVFNFPGVEYPKDGFGAPQVPLVTLLGLLVAYPEAGIGMIVRNFNTIEPVMGPLPQPKWMKGAQIYWPRMSVYLYVYIPAMGSEGAVGVEEVNLSRVFPPKLMDEFRKNSLSGRDEPKIGWGTFLSLGQKVADTLKREVTITHQYGGNMEYASYDKYEPFVPGGDGRIVKRYTTPPAFEG